MKTHQVHSLEETHAVAAAFSKELKAGDVIALHGDLGAGKTAFVQGLAKAMGVTSAVMSPTYTLIQEYSGIMPLTHIDVYRLHSDLDALGMGIEDYLYGDTVTAIEWASKIERLIPEEAWHITLELSDNLEERKITISKGAPE